MPFASEGGGLTQFNDKAKVFAVVPAWDQKGTRCVGLMTMPAMPWLPPQL